MTLLVALISPHCDTNVPCVMMALLHDSQSVAVWFLSFKLYPWTTSLVGVSLHVFIGKMYNLSPCLEMWSYVAT